MSQYKCTKDLAGYFTKGEVICGKHRFSNMANAAFAAGYLEIVSSDCECDGVAEVTELVEVTEEQEVTKKKASK